MHIFPILDHARRHTGRRGGHYRCRRYKHDENFDTETSLTLWSRRILRNDIPYIAMVCYQHCMYLNLGMTFPPD